jgi:hypothetical protein
MVELIVESDPSGAEVIIDDEVIGTTPLTIPIEISLETFRAECLSNGVVVCDWNTLQARLVNHDVSRFWWLVTEQERRSIAEVAIKNTLFAVITQKRKGHSDCNGGIGEWGSIVCVGNAMIRYLTFAKPMNQMDTCYWRYRQDAPEVCFAANDTYQLPCFMANCRKISPQFGHAMCAIQVVQGIDSLDNWIIFQYREFDIKPGSGQMPTGSSVDIVDPHTFAPCGSYSCWGAIASFEV